MSIQVTHQHTLFLSIINQDRCWHLSQNYDSRKVSRSKVLLTIQSGTGTTPSVSTFVFYLAECRTAVRKISVTLAATSYRCWLQVPYACVAQAKFPWQQHCVRDHICRVDVAGVEISLIMAGCATIAFRNGL